MNDSQLREAIASALKDIAPDLDGVKLDPDVSFRDQIDLDSIDYLQFVLALEEAFAIKVPEVDYPKLSSLNGALRYLKACASLTDGAT